MAVPTLEAVSNSLARNLGVDVHTIERQVRWRPCWFVDGAREGAPLRIMVRGERIDTFVQPLRQEVAFHRLLQDNGIAVPAILGWLDDVEAVALECVPGKDNFDGVDDATRDTVVDEYLQQLARLHSLDVEPFAEAGILRGATPDDSGMVLYDEWERLWRERKRHPNPWCEFALGWLHRNPPRSNGREAPIVWDSGQFHHHDGHLVSLLDLEFGHVGDPIADLAVWRMRGTAYPVGDFRVIYARYEELSGTPVDLEAGIRHIFAAGFVNEMMFGPGVVDPVPGMDLWTPMQWMNGTNLIATEALAEILDVELPSVEVPEPRVHRSANTFGHLARQLRALPTDDPFVANELELASRTVDQLARADEIADAVIEADLDDLEPLLGYRPETWQDGDAELERFVLAHAGDAECDVQLLCLFHRRIQRNLLQMGPLGSPLIGHRALPRFDGRPATTTVTFPAPAPA